MTALINIKQRTTQAWNLPVLLIVEQNTHTAVQECVTEAGLLVLDGVWYSAGTRSQCSPQQWDKWSRRAAAVALAPPQPVQEVARHRTHHSVGNEPEAVTFPLLGSKAPPGRAAPPPSAQCFVCFALLNQHCRRHSMHRDAAQARGSPGAFKYTVQHYSHAEKVNETSRWQSSLFTTRVSEGSPCFYLQLLLHVWHSLLKCVFVLLAVEKDKKTKQWLVKKKKSDN